MNLFAALHRRLWPHRRLALLLSAGLWGALTWSGLNLQMTDGTTAFFPDSSSEARDMVEAIDMTPFSRILPVLFTTDRADDKARLAAAADRLLASLPTGMAQRAGKLPDVAPEKLLAFVPDWFDEATEREFRSRTTREAMNRTLRQARDALATLPDAAVGKWIRTDPLNLRDFLLRRFPSNVGLPGSDPEYGYPLSPDGRHLLLLLRPSCSVRDTAGCTDLAEALSAGLFGLPSGITARMTGAHLHTAANATSIQADIERVLLWSLAGFAFVYTLLVRSFGALWLVLTPLFSAATALGILGVGWGGISALAVGFAASVLGISEDYAVHVHFALRSGLPAGNVLGRLAGPLVQGLLLNLTGFGVLFFSAVPALRQMAAFSILCLIAGCAVALVVLPLCPWNTRPRLPFAPVPGGAAEPAPLRTLLCFGVLLGAAVWLFFAVPVDVSPRSLGADAARLQETARAVSSIWKAGGAGQAIIVRGATEEEIFGNARQTSSALQTHGHSVLSLADMLPEPAEARKNRSRWEGFVNAEGAELLRRLYAAGHDNGFKSGAFLPFQRVLATAPVPLSPRSLEDAGLGELVRTFFNGRMALVVPQDNVAVLPNATPGHAVLVSPERLESIISSLFRQEQRLVPATFGLCLLLLLLFYKSPPRALLALTPAMAALVFILGWMYLSGNALTLAGLAALPLVIGLAIDHGVVVSHELEQGVSLGVPRAVWVSSLTACTGMGVLALASHPALRAMGQVIFLGLFMELPASLWLLPRLCRSRQA